MELLKKTYQSLFFLGVFFLPFNSYIPEWMEFLGEYSSDSSPIFFLASFMVLLVSFVCGERLYFPFKDRINFYLLVFTVCILLSTAVNVPDITEYYFKHTSGINRFLRQFFSYILIVFILFILFLTICKDLGVKTFFYKIRKYMLFSFGIVTVYCFIEIAIVKLHISFLRPLLNIFDYFPFTKVHLDENLRRISGPTYETPALGTYLITIFGFMFSYIFTAKHKILKYVPIGLVMFLGLISGSRTAFVVLLFQFGLAIFFAYLKYPRFRIIVKNMSIAAIFLALIGFTIFSKPILTSLETRMQSLNITDMKVNPKNNSISNKSRLGLQYALWETFKEKPILGAGWGQQAYISKYHLPKWATKNNWEFQYRYLNEDIKSFPPGYNLYLRILAETGLVGLIIFTIFLGSIIGSIKKLYTRIKGDQFIVIALILSISGFILNWFQIDSLRLYGFWISLAILITMKREYVK